ncbi:MAG TPA: hypothetical protein VLA29_02270 [Acidimicrobiia bacterium]|nr:hypothetical protein [Acidimicrobiia bacterium]
MDRFDDEEREATMPLRDRLPDYAAVFGVGLAASVAVGLVVWVVSPVSLASSIGYTVILYGVVLMLAGGATGGGYTNLGMGAVGAMFGSRRTDEPHENLGPTWSGRGRIDPAERLERGLRPDANPRAFWQVIGGLAYLGIGLAVVIIWS